MNVPMISLDATDTDEDENNPKTTTTNFRRNGSVRKVREIQIDVSIGEPPSSGSLGAVISRFGRSQSLRRPPTAAATTAPKNNGKNDENLPTPQSPGSTRSASPSPSFIDISPMLRTASLRVKNQLASRLSEPLKKAENRISRLLATEPDADDEQFQHYSLVHGLRGFNNNNQGEAEDADSSSDEDDPEYLELMERDSIINRYEKGPDAADVDAWENPNFELYTNLDRFGFVHKKGEKATADERTDLQKRRIIKELSREKKWLKMIEVWKSGGPSKKMEDRIWKGIPEKLRIVIWPRLLGAERLKHERRDVYAELLLRARLVSKDIKQIDLDINRTYRDHLAFRKRYDVKQKSLLNVLAAYSMFNTEVGYCQGMSQIAALFLMYLDEEDAFWSLHQLMVSPKHTMHGFFVPGFPKLQRYEEHFKRVLKKYKPRVYKHLEKQDIPYIYLTKWWFGCFLDRVPFSLALRLWDVFLVEGDCILIAMAYNIMKMHEKNVRKHNMESFMEFIQNDIAIDFGYSDDEVMHSLRETLSKLKSDRQHVPPPPRPEDLSEVPTKALGPILQKPMASIRDEIHEIQSRRSRANSTGRSPYPKRKESARGAGAPKGPPPVQHKWNGNASQDSILGNGGGGGAGGREVPFEIPTRRAPNGSPAAAAPTDAYNNSKNGALPPSGSSKRDFVQSSNTPTTTTHSSSSHRYQHSNSSRGGTPLAQRLRDERSGQVVLLSRASDSEPDVGSPMTNTRDSDWNGSAAHISTATSRITHSGNHITRIDLDGDVSVI
ncbi:Rab-GAP TBC domain-containing protein [Caenorhabditis elegans]|uniref:Rab-GAP TBC domain-containing protein n=1 Tax=Caenorhabditis elegans TaxID=6239 RepID=B7FAS5_CAEEL|nr:Rab-GAP TBC domain-containing protein [Caenorhabditis elegans]CAT01079.1 Rab-GAP TBC domain-containing protein [Caenorhabditis elegans]|eukprot:NP_001254356.1 TBC (Tre-2/Bub2/Cdc16) domain family [Caenorhabditis elegans]